MFPWVHAFPNLSGKSVSPNRIFESNVDVIDVSAPTVVLHFVPDPTGSVIEQLLSSTMSRFGSMGVAVTSWPPQPHVCVVRLHSPPPQSVFALQEVAVGPDAPASVPVPKVPPPLEEDPPEGPAPDAAPPPDGPSTSSFALELHAAITMRKQTEGSARIGSSWLFV
jgi:hypothetical protein